MTSQPTSKTIDKFEYSDAPQRSPEWVTTRVGKPSASNLYRWLAVGKREVRVGTATTDVVLGDVQSFGRKRMPAADWGRGTTLPDRPVLA